MNAAARFVALIGKFAHITPVLRDVLHWLPVFNRTSLCWLLTVFGAWGRRISRASVFPCLTTLAGPVFVLLNVFVPRTRTKLGTRSFLVPASVVWNSLPTELRSTSVSRDTFRSTLKSRWGLSSSAQYWTCWHIQLVKISAVIAKMWWPNDVSLAD